MERKALKLVWALFAAVSMAYGAAPEKVAKVESGELKEARLSWWGFNKDDSTEILKAAFGSNAKTLVIDKMETPWITNPQFLKGNMDLVFEDGAEIMAIAGGFKDKKESLITIDGQSNITISGLGKGGILRMRKADYQSDRYTKAEWRHCLNLLSAENITIKNMSMVESGGDGIYIGVSKVKKTPCKNITISKVICDKNHRQGISVIAAINLLIEDTILSNTIGTNPQCGIDFEPNGANESLINCVMRNCISENNRGGGYVFYLPNMDTRKCGKISIRLENCVSRNESASATSLTTSDRKLRGNMYEGEVSFVNCTFENPRSVAFNMGLDLSNQLKVIVKDCKVIGGGGKAGVDYSPFVVSYLRGASFVPVASQILLDNLSITHEKAEKWLVVDDQACIGYKNYAISGTVNFSKNGQAEKITVDKGYMEKMFSDRVFVNVPAYDIKGKTFVPASDSVVNPGSLSKTKCRNAGDFWLYARAGSKIRMELKYAKLVRFTGDASKAILTTPSGKTIELGKVEFNSEKELVVESAPETGVYFLNLNVGKNWAALKSCNCPAGIFQAQEDGFNFINSTGDYYFYIPEGTGLCGIRFRGQGGGEGAKASLFDPSGKEVWSKDNVTYTTECSLGNKPMPGIWSIKIEKASRAYLEDFGFRFLGIPQFLSADKAQTLILK